MKRYTLEIIDAYRNITIQMPFSDKEDTCLILRAHPQGGAVVKQANVSICDGQFRLKPVGTVVREDG